MNGHQPEGVTRTSLLLPDRTGSPRLAAGIGDGAALSVDARSHAGRGKAAPALAPAQEL